MLQNIPVTGICMQRSQDKCELRKCDLFPYNVYVIITHVIYNVSNAHNKHVALCGGPCLLDVYKLFLL